MKPPLAVLLLLFLLPACSDKHLDNKTFTSRDIKVNWYSVSSIETIHDYVDLERSGHTVTIMKSNTEGIYDIRIDRDTVTIQITRNLLVYDLTAKTLGCYIKLDSSITTYEYMKKYRPKEADYYKDEKRE